jgi:hypothetical protein
MIDYERLCKITYIPTTQNFIIGFFLIEIKIQTQILLFSDQVNKLSLHPMSIPFIIKGPIFLGHKLCHVGKPVI